MSLPSESMWLTETGIGQVASAWYPAIIFMVSIGLYAFYLFASNPCFSHPFYLNTSAPWGLT